MPRTLPLAAAQSHLSQLVAGMVPGEELVLTADGEPVAVVTRPARTSWPSQPGTAKDQSFWMAPDFDAPLEDFAEYME
jgi:antitoxin (DNA-binding transcriptional repressor) of toxin-antitoxin stability system